MNRFDFPGKSAKRLEKLKAHLEANGFPNALVLSEETTPPRAIVYVDSGDPTTLVNAWSDPACIDLASNKPAGTDGVPECPSDNSSVHALTIKKVDENGNDITSGSDQVKVIPSSLVTVTPSATPSMTNGQVVVSVGPTSMVGEVLVRVVGDGNDLKEQEIRLRFV